MVWLSLPVWLRYGLLMRVTTDFWVSALLRRVFSQGGFGAIVRRGATEAGAVFVASPNRLGEVRLLGAGPQTVYDETKPDERLFVEILTGSQDEVDKKLEREVRFDPDLWIVEVETDDLKDFMQIVAS